MAKGRKESSAQKKELEKSEYDKYKENNNNKKLDEKIKKKKESEEFKKQKRDDDDGKFIGHSHKSPLLDTGLQDVKFDDGDVETFAANQIAENIFAQVGNERKGYALMDEIVEHQKTGQAITKDDRFMEYCSP